MTRPKGEGDLAPGAQRLVRIANEDFAAGHPRTGLHHYLIALLQHHGQLVEALVPGLAAPSYLRDLRAKLRAGDIGEAFSIASLTEELVTNAHSRGKDRAYEIDVAFVLLRKAGWTIAAGGEAFMPIRLSSLQLEELTPLLGPLARMVAREVKVSDGELRVLLLGSDTEIDEGVIAEMRRWTMLLEQLREQPTIEMRTVTEEALRLRGVAQASAALATQLVSVREASAQDPILGIVVRPARIDFGTLRPGGSAEAEIEIEGGAGEVVSDSDQVTVSSHVFGPAVTRVSVRVTSVGSGTLWTKIRLVSGVTSIEIPVVASWNEPEPAFAPALPRSQPPSPDQQNEAPLPSRSRPSPRQGVITQAAAATTVRASPLQASRQPLLGPAPSITSSSAGWFSFWFSLAGLTGIAASLTLPWVSLHGNFSYSLGGGLGAWSGRWQLAAWWQDAPDNLDALVIIATLLIGIRTQLRPPAARGLAPVGLQPRDGRRRLLLTACGGVALAVGALQVLYVNNLANAHSYHTIALYFYSDTSPIWPAIGLIALMGGGAALIVSSWSR